MSSLPALLLRLLLSLALIFNGSGYAYAATQMHPGVAIAVSMDDQRAGEHDAAVQDAPPCHGAMGEEMADPAPVEEPAGHDGHGSPDGSDCCQTDQCDCVCAQHVPATSLAVWQRSPALERSHAPAYRPVRHLAPALSNLQRPPIG